jgi:uncharacterized protein YpuA (DUF1002 family)
VTDLLNPPAVDLRATTKKLITVMGDALDALSDNDRVSTAVLDILNDVKVLPLTDREVAAKLVDRVFREVGYDGVKDAALTQAVSFHRKMLKL